jgi:hypothetical protein
VLNKRFHFYLILIDYFHFILSSRSAPAITVHSFGGNDVQPIEEMMRAATGVFSRSAAYRAIRPLSDFRHVRSISSRALNLHFSRQCPQAVHLSGYFTAARIPFSSPVISST